jgi:hypothetical protein
MKKRLFEGWIWIVDGKAIGEFVPGRKKPKPRIVTDEDGCQYRAAGRWILVAGFTPEYGAALKGHD